MAAMTTVEGIEIGLKQIAEVASNHNAKIKESKRFQLSSILLTYHNKLMEPKRKGNNLPD